MKARRDNENHKICNENNSIDNIVSFMPNDVWSEVYDIMSKGKRKRKAQLQNFNNENIWFQRIMRLASSSIHWKGLPDEVDTVLMENLINRSSGGILGYDDILGQYVIAQNASVGQLDVNGYPTIRRGVCVNGTNVSFGKDDSVIIYNNSAHTSDIWIWLYWAEYMSNLDQAIRVNCNTQKTMAMIPTSQQQALTIENVYENLEDNIPYILLDSKGVDIENLKNALVFDNSNSFTGDKLLYVQNEVWNRILTMLGINNINHFKRERVNIAETDANLNEVFFMRRDRLNIRKRAAEQMNKLWGLNVEVEYYADEVEVRQGGLLYDRSQDNMPELLSGTVSRNNGGTSD